MAQRSVSHLSRQRHSFHGPGSADARARYHAERNLVAAMKWRERRIKQAQRTTGLTAAYDESERLGQVLSRDTDAVFDFRVRSLADLTAKLDFMEARELHDDEVAARTLAADIRRLTNKGA